MLPNDAITGVDWGFCTYIQYVLVSLKSEELHPACRHAERVFQLLGRVHEATGDNDGVEGPVSGLVSKNVSLLYVCSDRHCCQS